MSTFFRNVDTRFANPVDVPSRVSPAGEAISDLASLRARAILVDMEEGVVNQLLRSPLGELFDPRQCVTDVSGAGNNWAHGYHGYGREHGERLEEAVRCALEPCESPQSFLLLHSLGGGTGSGVGSFFLEMLHDHYPDLFRFAIPVMPSERDDVVIAPYNTTLAMEKLVEHADCVLPLANESLMRVCGRIDRDTGRGGDTAGKSAAPGIAETGLSHVRRRKPKRGTAAGRSGSAFDTMNNVAAHLVRTPKGSLNVDLNEVATNLVPFPRMNFLVPSLTPLYMLADQDARWGPRTIDQMFRDSLRPEFQLLPARPADHTMLACGFMARGSPERISGSDVQRNVSDIQRRIRMVHWNQDGFKTGLCNVPPIGLDYSLMGLFNSTGIAPFLGNVRSRFQQLFRARAHMHHYTSWASVDDFASADESIARLMEDYTKWDEDEPGDETDAVLTADELDRVLDSLLSE